jgi:hypothetical protein
MSSFVEVVFTSSVVVQPSHVPFDSTTSLETSDVVVVTVSEQISSEDETCSQVIGETSVVEDGKFSGQVDEDTSDEVSTTAVDDTSGDESTIAVDDTSGDE